VGKQSDENDDLFAAADARRPRATLIERGELAKLPG